MPKKKSSIVIEKHNLIPKHSVCSDKEKQQVLDKYKTDIGQLPKISINDAGLTNFKIKIGDMIKVERKDSFSGKTNFYRVVVDE